MESQRLIDIANDVENKPNKDLYVVADELNEEFENLNTNNVYFLFYCTMGLFSKDVRELSLTVLENFINYLQTKQPFYIPKTGLESMFHPELVKKIYLWLKYNKSLIKSIYRL